MSKAKVHGAYSPGLWGGPGPSPDHMEFMPPRGPTHGIGAEGGCASLKLWGVGKMFSAASRSPTSRLAEHGAGNLRGCGPHFLREGFNKLSVPAVGAAAKLKIEKDFRLESPHGESVLQPAC
jgi:hypothetical protein